ncbi:MAG: hypothetical protein GXZ01_11295 [Clostridiaceae bacterium]|nr:hypothetical protein [Clostridiaceae bacterium]
MKKRILAWIALIIFIALMVNLMFIQYMVTESICILILYLLFFFYYSSKQNTGRDNSPANTAPDEDSSKTEE